MHALTPIANGTTSTDQTTARAVQTVSVDKQQTGWANEIGCRRDTAPTEAKRFCFYFFVPAKSIKSKVFFGPFDFLLPTLKSKGLHEAKADGFDGLDGPTGNGDGRPLWPVSGKSQNALFRDRPCQSPGEQKAFRPLFFKTMPMWYCEYLQTYFVHKP
jgi:hypothetical protein